MITKYITKYAYIAIGAAGLIYCVSGKDFSYLAYKGILAVILFLVLALPGYFLIRLIEGMLDTGPGSKKGIHFKKVPVSVLIHLPQTRLIGIGIMVISLLASFGLWVAIASWLVIFGILAKPIRTEGGTKVTNEKKIKKLGPFSTF